MPANPPAPTTRVLRHVVLFDFKEGTTPQQIEEIETTFRRLPDKIDLIHAFEWGTDVSVENLAQGYSHCFLVSFQGEAERDAYLPHPAHQEFVALVQPHLAQALVLDYWTET